MGGRRGGIDGILNDIHWDGNILVGSGKQTCGLHMRRVSRLRCLRIDGEDNTPFNFGDIFIPHLAYVEWGDLA